MKYRYITFVLLFPLLLSGALYPKHSQTARTGVGKTALNYRPESGPVFQNGLPYSLIPLNNSDRFKKAVERHQLPLSPAPIQNKFLLLKTSSNTATEILDSLFYDSYGTYYKEKFAYDEELRLSHSEKQWRTDTLQSWTNSQRITYMYHTSGNIEEIVGESWDAVMQQWVYSSKSHSTYDSNNRLVQWQYFLWDTSQTVWVNYYQTLYTYDNDGNLITVLSQNWDSDGQSWINAYMSTYTYDENGNPLTYVFQSWNTDTQSWDNYSRNTNTYDDQGSIITSVSEYWDTDSNDWVYDQRYTYTYDTNEVRLNKTGYRPFFRLLIEKWQENEIKWTNYEQVTNSYDDNLNLTESIDDLWDELLEKFAHNYRFKFVYSSNVANQLLEKTDFVWDTDNDVWENDSRTEYTYTASGNIDLKKYMSWSNQDQQWQNENRWSYEYNMNDHLIEFSGAYWDGDQWVTYPLYMEFEHNKYWYAYYTSSLMVFYSPATALDDERVGAPSSFTLSQNFPNPFNPGTVIPYTIGEKEKVKLTVYNTLGQRVAVLVNKEQIPGKYTVYFNASSLASGVYYFRLKTESYTKTRRMLLLR